MEKESYLSERFEPTIYFVRGIARKLILRKSIDVEYSKNREKYSFRGKDNPWHSSRYLQENDYEEEITCYKVLGIFSEWIVTRDDKLGKWFINLIRRGYPNVYEYFYSHDTINMEDFFREVLAPISDYMLEMNSCIGTIIVLAIIENKEIEKIKADDGCKLLLEDTMQNIKQYAYPPRKLLEELCKEDSQIERNAKILMKNINADKINTLGEADRIEDKELHRMLQYLEETSKLAGMSNVAYEQDYFTSRDMLDICKYIVINNVDWGTEPRYLALGMLSMATARKYKNLKKYCSDKAGDLEDITQVKNLKSKLYKLEDKILLAKAEKDLLKKQLSDTQNQQLELDKIKVDYSDLKNKMEEEKDTNNILTEIIEDLRKYPQVLQAPKLNFIPRTVIVGGHENWVKTMSKKHSDYIFTNGTNAIKECAKASRIVFKYDFLSHKVYKPCIAYARKNDIPVLYISGNSDPFK